MSKSAWDMIRVVLSRGPASMGLLRDQTGLPVNRISRALEYHIKCGHVGTIPGRLVSSDRGFGGGRRSRVYFLVEDAPPAGSKRSEKAMNDEQKTPDQVAENIERAAFRFTDAGRTITAGDVATHSGQGERACAQVLRRLGEDGILLVEVVKRVPTYRKAPFVRGDTRSLGC